MGRYDDITPPPADPQAAQKLNELKLRAQEPLPKLSRAALISAKVIDKDGNPTSYMPRKKNEMTLSPEALLALDERHERETQALNDLADSAKRHTQELNERS